MFSAEELLEFVRLADYVAVNDYEGKMLEEKTGRSLERLAREVKALIVTLGAQGSRIIAGEMQHKIPVAVTDRVVDPTGCGDAYRAGLLYGIAQGWDWPRIGRLGAVLGAIKIASRGAQNHRVDRATVEARYRQSFRESPWG
jgi:adenosine kinase